MSDRQTYEQLAEQRDDLASRLRDVTNELETERMRLAACSTAALGYFNRCIDEYKSAALNDVLALRERAAELQRQLDEAAKQEPVAQVISDCSTDGTALVSAPSYPFKLSFGDRLYTHPINLPALIEQARAEEREMIAADLDSILAPEMAARVRNKAKEV